MPTTFPERPAAATPATMLLAVSRDWRLFRSCGFLGVLFAVLAVLSAGPRFSTGVSFVPQGSGSGQLRGLAAQFGFDVAGSDGAESPFFYVELLATPELLSHVVTRRFANADTSGDYATFATISETDSAVRVVKAIKGLKKNLQVVADRRTSLVSYTVTERDPAVAFQLATALLDEIARYNRETRQSQAAAERRFVENRLSSARKEVLASEDSLQRFLVANRSYRTSPELTFEYERLQRSVTHRAGVVSSLAQNYEQTRIDEVRDTPVISMVQPPRVAARADPRGWRRSATVGLVGGLVIAFIVRMILASLARLRLERPEVYDGWREMLLDLRRNVYRR